MKDVNIFSWLQQPVVGRALSFETLKSNSAIIDKIKNSSRHIIPVSAVPNTV
jgi:hypothetical protein